MQRVEGIDGRGRQMEINVLLVNGEEAVAIEVKTTLKVDDVAAHEERLKEFRSVFPEYREKRLLGGVAALRVESSSDKYAYRRGLFVLRLDQGFVRIVNDSDFCPREF